jgi:hypothetical protein
VQRLREEEARKQSESTSAESRESSTSQQAPVPDEPPRKNERAPDGTPSNKPRSASNAFHVGVDARAGLGFTPHPSFGVGLTAGWTVNQALMLQLDGGLLFPRRLTRPDGSVEVSLLEGGVAVAAALGRFGRLHPFLGLHAAAGRADLSGHGYPEAKRGRSAVVRAGLLAVAQVDFASLMAQLSAQLETPIVGYRAVLATDSGVREELGISPVVLVLSAGVGVPFP